MDPNSPKISHHNTDNTPTNYAYSGKVMLISVIVLFIFCFIFAAFHFYSRWFITRRSATHRHHRRRRFSFSAAGVTSSDDSKGLAPSVLKLLPTFVYSAGHTPLDCAVCLSEFEVNETGRVLPKCNHAFHAECIDMWLLSHSNCPLCRAPIHLSDNSAHNNPTQTVIDIPEPDPNRLSPICNNGNSLGSSASSPSLPQLLNGNMDIPPAIRRQTDIGLKMVDGPGPGPVSSLKRFLSI